MSERLIALTHDSRSHAMASLYLVTERQNDFGYATSDSELGSCPNSPGEPACRRLPKIRGGIFGLTLSRSATSLSCSSASKTINTAAAHR